MFHYIRRFSAMNLLFKVIFKSSMMGIFFSACGSSYASLEGEREVISSPFQMSSRIPCQYTISGPVGKRIQINFIAFNNSNPNPSYNHIVLKIIEGNGSFVGPAKIHRNGQEYPTTYLTVGNVAQVVATHQRSNNVHWSFTFEYIVVDGKSLIQPYSGPAL